MRLLLSTIIYRQETETTTTCIHPYSAIWWKLTCTTGKSKENKAKQRVLSQKGYCPRTIS